MVLIPYSSPIAIDLAPPEAIAHKFYRHLIVLSVYLLDDGPRLGKVFVPFFNAHPRRSLRGDIVEGHSLSGRASSTGLRPSEGDVGSPLLVCGYDGVSRRELLVDGVQ